MYFPVIGFKLSQRKSYAPSGVKLPPPHDIATQTPPLHIGVAESVQSADAEHPSPGAPLTGGKPPLPEQLPRPLLPEAPPRSKGGPLGGPAGPLGGPAGPLGGPASPLGGPAGPLGGPAGPRGGPASGAPKPISLRWWSKGRGSPLAKLPAFNSDIIMIHRIMVAMQRVCNGHSTKDLG